MRAIHHVLPAIMEKLEIHDDFLDEAALQVDDDGNDDRVTASGAAGQD
jgi:hypothetical protein